MEGLSVSILNLSKVWTVQTVIDLKDKMKFKVPFEERKRARSLEP
jgi:hypothetical protein